MRPTFPLDFRDRYRWQRLLIGRLKWAAPLLLLVFVLVGLPLLSFPMLWVLGVITILAVAFLLRCPACNGPGPLFLPLSFGCCSLCGSRLVDGLEASNGLEFFRAPCGESHPIPDTSQQTGTFEPTPEDKNTLNPRTLGLLVISASAFVGYVACSSIVLECQRTSKGETRILYSEQLLGWKHNVLLISNVTGCTSQAKSSARSGGGLTHKLVFETTQGDVEPNRTSRSGGDLYRKTASQVRDFLSHPGQTHRRITQPPDWIAWIAFFFLFLIGTGLLFKRRPTVEFLPRSHRLRLGSRNIEFQLHDVECFGVASRDDEEGRPSRRSGTAMRLHSGEVILLTDRFNDGDRDLKLTQAMDLEYKRRQIQSLLESQT